MTTTADQPATTTPAKARPNTPRLCRVSLLIGEDTLLDKVLPAGVPLVTIIEDLLPRINRDLQRRGVAPLTTDATTYTLCWADGHPLEVTTSLDDAGVLDGDLLLLLPVESTERFEPVIEEVATGLARAAAARFRRADANTARRVAGGLLIALVVWAEIILAQQWRWSGGWIPAAVSWSIAVALAIAAALAAHAKFEQRHRASDVLAWSAIIAATWAAVLSVPKPSPWCVLAGAATAIAAVKVLNMLTGRFLSTLYALSVVFGVGAVAVMLAPLGWHLKPEQIATTVLMVVLVLVTWADSMGISGSGIPGPRFPSISNKGIFERPDGAPADIVSPVDAGQGQSGADHAKWALKGNRILDGVLTGAAVLTVAASRYAVAPGRDWSWRLLAFTLGVCLILVLRSRSFRDRYHSSVLVVAGVLGVAMVIGRYASASTPPQLSTTLICVGAVAALAVMGLIVALVLPTTRISAPTNRFIQLLEYVPLAVLVPWWLWAIGVLELVRNLPHGV